MQEEVISNADARITKQAAAIMEMMCEFIVNLYNKILMQQNITLNIFYCILALCSWTLTTKALHYKHFF